MKEKLLKYENAKLKHQLIFSIPANKEVCGRECPGCYAMKFQKLYKSVLPYRERRYEASQQESFVQTIVDEINACKKPLAAIRIHESGEFYSQEYIDKWFQIAQKLPNQTFYAFTKRRNDFEFSHIESLDNFILIDSLKHGKINYGDDKYIASHPTANICPVTQNKPVTCGTTCTFCMTKGAQHNGILFRKH